MWSMRWSSFKQLEPSKSLQNTETAHKGLLCSLQSNSAPAIVYRQKVNCIEATAVVVLYLTASENRNFHSTLENKTV